MATENDTGKVYIIILGIIVFLLYAWNHTPENIEKDKALQQQREKEEDQKVHDAKFRREIYEVHKDLQEHQ